MKLKKYIQDWIIWFFLTYQLISKPLVTVFNFLFEISAPKWLVYIILKNNINNLDYYSNYALELINKLLQDNRISKKQADKLVELLNSKERLKRKTSLN